MDSDYEYRGLMAESWDLLRGDPSGRFDRDFYLEASAQFGEPVLDVGCGTGRLLLDFLALSIDIEGVDISPEMLEICRKKAQQLNLSPILYEQSIVSLALPRRFRTILAPSSVLQLITEPEAVRQAVERLYQHLEEGGALIAPFMTLWRPGNPLQQEWENAQVRELDGALLHRMGRVRYDPVDECEHTEDLYQVIVDGEMVAVEHHRRSPASRSYTQAQARRLFEDAGFGDIALFQGFTKVSATEGATLFTVVAVRHK